MSNYPNILFLYSDEYSYRWCEASAWVSLIISTLAHHYGELTVRKIAAPASIAEMYSPLCGLTATPLATALDGIDPSLALHGKDCSDLDDRPDVITE